MTLTKTTINEKEAVTPNQLLELVESHGLSVSWERMAGGYLGAVDLRTGTIFLDHSLDARPRALVSTLAHELGHVALMHGCSQGERGEQMADQWAAQLLITPERFARAERLYGSNAYEVARELGVTQGLVRAYRRTLGDLAA